MLIEVRKVNQEGFIEELIVVDSMNIPEDFIIDRVDGLIKPKWNGLEWEEGITQEELDAMLAEQEQYEPEIPLEERIAQLEAKNAELENTLNTLFGV